MNEQPYTNWWNRNWKWFVPVGCLGSIVLFIGFIVLIMSVVFGVMKSSDIYKEALEIATADPVVQKSIGTPIEEGMFITGNMNVNGPSGSANISIPISGPVGKATIYAVASKTAGQWTYSTLVVEIENTKHRIDLLE